MLLLIFVNTNSIYEPLSARISLCFSSDPVGKKQRGDDEVEIEETAQEKKLRLAKGYLDQLREEGENMALFFPIP